MNKDKKTMLIAAGVLVIALYRLGSPYLEHTKEIQAEAEKAGVVINALKQEAAMFGQGWENTMTKREEEVNRKFPDSLNSSDVLNYFLSKFEQAHPGRAWFLAVNYQRATNSDFKTGTGSSTVAARSIRYKITAELGQEVVVPFIEHIEKYSGLFRSENYGFSVSPTRGNALQMELALEFFLTPKEWVPPGVLVADMEPEEEEKGQKKTWQQIFVSNPNARGPAGKPAPAKLPVVEKIIGTSVVVNENLYEEGDSVGGWKVDKVSPSTRKVIFKWGSVTKEVSVK